MQTERRPLSEVHIAGENPRHISDAKLNSLVDSLLVFPGMLELRPVVVDSDYVALGGNMRLHALGIISLYYPEDIRNRLANIRDFAKRTKPQREALLSHWFEWLQHPTVPVVKADSLTGEERRQFAIKDNVAYGQWDFDLLKAQFTREELQGWGMDEWEDEVEDLPTILDDETPPTVEDTPRVKTGELWQLGRHYLLCGDSTKPEDMRRLMGDRIADLMITDPPYNVDYQGGTRDQLNIQNDSFASDEAFSDFLAAASPRQTHS